MMLYTKKANNVLFLSEMCKVILTRWALFHGPDLPGGDCFNAIQLSPIRLSTRHVLARLALSAAGNGISRWAASLRPQRLQSTGSMVFPAGAWMSLARLLENESIT
jgi:hypothetical protein